MSARIGKFLADIVLALHFIVVALVLSTVPLAWFVPPMRPAIVISVLTMIVLWITLRECPLSRWEHRLRVKYHTEGVHEHSFFHHHVGRKFGLEPKGSRLVSILYPVLSLCIIFFA